MESRVKIVLDADVVIDFIDGKRLIDLPRFLPSYDFVLLDIVYNEELSKNPVTKNYIDRLTGCVKGHKGISIIEWKPDNETLKIYAHLNQTKGKGESACIAYCQTHNDVVASSNLKDIEIYCQENNITYLTFLDLVWYAWKNKVLTLKECNECIQEAAKAGNKIPNVDISKYQPKVSFL